MIEINGLPSSGVLIYDSDQPRSANTARFIKNEIIKGRVLKLLDSNTALINIKGRDFSARTQVPLKVGSEMTFKVEKLTPVPELRALGIQFVKPEAANISAILSALKDNLWKSVFDKISTVKGSTPEEISYSQIIDSLPKKLLKSGKTEYVKEIINRSGLFLESKLKQAIGPKPLEPEQIRQLIKNDIKGMLLGLISETDDEDAKQLLSVIKSLQLLHISGVEQERKMFIPLPLLLPDGHFCTAQLLFKLPKLLKDIPEESEENENPLKISLFLELSNLGPIKADFTLKGKTLYGMFGAAVAETVEILENSMESFRNTLLEKGFYIQHIECRLKEPEIINEPLIFNIIQTTENNVNLVG
ncbi:MAG: flagellar hook-length control protein FliK [Proteobacteria bacterium]|nr:flagellar hook-length control protein FliK [Pseudomonadota bacterium]